MSAATPKPARPPLRLSLQFADRRHRELLPRHKVLRWLRAALDEPAELTVRVVSDEEGQALNEAYRGKRYPTNVLTFAYADSEAADDAPISADLVLAAGVVEREAQELGLPVQDHYAHLLVHGTLHAQGWDHEEDDEAEAMEARESAILLALGLHDPYAPR